MPATVTSMSTPNPAARVTAAQPPRPAPVATAPPVPALPRRAIVAAPLALGALAALAPSARADEESVPESVEAPAAEAAAGEEPTVVEPETIEPIVEEPVVEASEPFVPKVVVFGGSGFVGQAVCERLVGTGVSVVSVSRSGRPASAKGAWADAVAWEKADALVDDLSSLTAGASAVVSCIGTIAVGKDNSGKLEAGNGKANERVVAAASAAGAPKFVYVSVSKTVEPGTGGVPGLDGYFKGKAEAEAAISAAYPTPGSAVLVRPTFIYGGSSFTVDPPRVPGAYGGLVEGVLSTGLFRAAADATPGFISLALRPPVAVEKVAGAVAAATLGLDVPAVVDGTDEINSAAGLLGYY